MAKYLLLKHYRGAPPAVNDVPMEQWTPEEVEAHVRFMRDLAARLERTGEFVEGRPSAELQLRPVTEGESWLVIDGALPPPPL